MKEINRKSQIILTKDELDLIIPALELWIEIDKQHNSFCCMVDILLERIKYRYTSKKNIYHFNFTFYEFGKVHDSLADQVLFYNGNYNKLKLICEKLEEIIKKNYGLKNLKEILYLTQNWDKVIQNQIAKKLLKNKE